MPDNVGDSGVRLSQLYQLLAHGASYFSIPMEMRISFLYMKSPRAAICC
jgi:hypothetical protein